MRFDENKAIITIDNIMYNGTYLLMQFRFGNLRYVNYSKDFLEEFIDQLSKRYEKEEIKNYCEKIDLVGSRFYYLRKNIINQQFLQYTNMESISIQIINSELYTKSNYKEIDLQKYKVENENEEYNKLFHHFNKHKYYIDIQYNK